MRNRNSVVILVVLYLAFTSLTRFAFRIESSGHWSRIWIVFRSGQSVLLTRTTRGNGRDAAIRRNKRLQPGIRSITK